MKSIFNFTLRAHSDFYKKVEKFYLTLLDSFQPERITKVAPKLPSLNELLMSESALIFFELPQLLENISDQIMFHIKFKPKVQHEWEDVLLTNYDTSNLQEKFLILKNVKYANTIYQFKVRIKTKTSMDIEEMWSPFVGGTFKTNSKLPEMLPSTCDNCYNVNENGRIYIYWTEVPKFYQNGNNFTYMLKIFDFQTKVLLNQTTCDKTFYMMPDNMNKSHIIVHIYSFNHIGISKNFTSLELYTEPSKNMLRIKKEWIDGKIGYKLSWKLYENVTHVEAFTVIWCRQTNELPNQCEYPINYIFLPPDETEFYLNTTKSNQFGISVKTTNSIGKGIQWSKCTSSRPDGNFRTVLNKFQFIRNLLILFTEIGTLNSLWTKYILENTIQLEWSVNCADKDIISAYHIGYCVVANFNSDICLSNETFEDFDVNGDEQFLNKYLLTNLKPYKIYKVSISLISTSGRYGVLSKPLWIKTLEGSE